MGEMGGWISSYKNRERVERSEDATNPVKITQRLSSIRIAYAIRKLRSSLKCIKKKRGKKKKKDIFFPTING